MGTVVVATGAATGTAFFFLLDKKGTMPPQQIESRQQMPSAKRNQAHQGQPPPSVVLPLIASFAGRPLGARVRESQRACATLALSSTSLSQ